MTDLLLSLLVHGRLFRHERVSLLLLNVMDPLNELVAQPLHLAPHVPKLGLELLLLHARLVHLAPQHGHTRRWRLLLTLLVLLALIVRVGLIGVCVPPLFRTAREVLHCLHVVYMGLHVQLLALW